MFRMTMRTDNRKMLTFFSSAFAVSHMREDGFRRVEEFKQVEEFYSKGACSSGKSSDHL